MVVFKEGDKVIITKGDLAGKVVWIDNVTTNPITGEVFLAMLGSDNLPIVGRARFYDLVHVKQFNELENAIDERGFVEEAFMLKMFVLTSLAVIFLTIGVVFTSFTPDNVINLYTGVIALAGGAFCWYVVKETRKDRKSFREGLNKEFVDARISDLMEE